MIARQPLSRVNVTELLRRLLVKIENIYLFKIIIIKNMETSLKTGFAQIFSCCPKNLSCPNFGGAAAPLAPPARTPMPLSSITVIFKDQTRNSIDFSINYFECLRILLCNLTIYLVLIIILNS